MNRIKPFLLIFFMCLPLIAQAHNGGKGDYHKIAMHFTARDWVETKTALVSVNIDAALTNRGMLALRTDLLNNLKSIAPARWHLTGFDRSKDASGLERVKVRAQARIDENQLNDLRARAKKLSRPGAQYKIATIAFQPTLEDMAATRKVLRERLYTDIKAELATLNKVYPDQNYVIHKIKFQSSDLPTTRVKAAQQNYALRRGATKIKTTTSLAISKRLTMIATVVFGAKAGGDKA